MEVCACCKGPKMLEIESESMPNEKQAGVKYYDPKAAAVKQVYQVNNK